MHTSGLAFKALHNMTLLISEELILFIPLKEVLFTVILTSHMLPESRKPL